MRTADWAQAVAEAVDDGTSGGGISISLREPLTGVAKGQAVVLYRPDSELGDQVLGSGTISGTESEPNTL